MTVATTAPSLHAEHDQPLWYKDAIIYETHVRAFFDSNEDGIGDFRGLVEKLDYLHDLGVTAIWLLPFYPSPLKDDGYDIADYFDIHPAYGKLRDFRMFLKEAHRRGLRVITELVINHTSDQHPWFQRARNAPPGSPERDFYVWSDTSDKYQDARIIFRDFEPSNWAWDPVAGAYYWHRFYSHQPDLNYGNPAVRNAVYEVVDFWLGMGVDGLRLDAVPYLIEEEGTDCENLPGTHQVLKDLRRYIDERYTDRMLLAEANQWPEESVAYFGDGDECHMAFHFPLMPRLFMAIRTEDRFPIVDILSQTPAIPETCQWALFLRNHDELTLEMVTDEERLYMYRAYAQAPEAKINLGIRRRLAPLLSNNRRRIELMNALLFSMPGTPVIYYGDELGMGDNIFLGDRNGVRTPMQWSDDRHAGFSRAHPQRLYLPLITDHEYHYETIHVEAQEHNHHSLLWWMRGLIARRKRHRAFGRGTLEFLQPTNRRIIAFVRRYRDEQILVVANLSRFVQGVELDLSEFRGLVPVEMVGRARFWPIEDRPYALTLGPHAFYWFSLEPERTVPASTDDGGGTATLPVIATRGRWDDIVHGEARTQLEEVLPDYLLGRTWFHNTERHVLAIHIAETIAVPNRDPFAYIALVSVAYADGDPEMYALPMAFAPDRDGRPWSGPTAARIARVSLLAEGEATNGTLIDAMWDPRFPVELLELIAHGRHLRGIAGTVVPQRLPNFRAAQGGETANWKQITSVEDFSNTSVQCGDRLILKFFRRLDEGTNPELEIGTVLTEAGFAHVPPTVGALEYRRNRLESMTLAVVQEAAANQGTAWEAAQEALEAYFAKALASGGAAPESKPATAGPLLAGAKEDPPELVGPFLDVARRLGRQTAHLHHALAASSTNPTFVPIAFTPFSQRSLYQTMRGRIGRVMSTLRLEVDSLQEPARSSARELLDMESRVLERARALLSNRIEATAIRCHGDFHLEQVLCSGDQFLFIDFEGEPALPVAERQLKRSPLRDLAAMIRSFQYAADVALERQAMPPEAADLRHPVLGAWARYWHFWVAAGFLGSYLDTAAGTVLVPAGREQIEMLLDAYLLERAIAELGHELANDPARAVTPLLGILELIGPQPDGAGSPAADWSRP